MRMDFHGSLISSVNTLFPVWSKKTPGFTSCQGQGSQLPEMGVKLYKCDVPWQGADEIGTAPMIWPPKQLGEDKRCRSASGVS